MSIQTQLDIAAAAAENGWERRDFGDWINTGKGMASTYTKDGVIIQVSYRPSGAVAIAGRRLIDRNSDVFRDGRIFRYIDHRCRDKKASVIGWLRQSV